MTSKTDIFTTERTCRTCSQNSYDNMIPIFTDLIEETSSFELLLELQYLKLEVIYFYWTIM